MFSAVAQSVDATSVQWAAGCCALSGAFYGALRVGLKGRDDVDFATRFEWAVRGVESAQAAYVGSYALAHLLGGGGPLPVVVVRRMAGYLWFDTAYELVLPYVRGHGTWGAAFLAHHLVGLAAHGLAVTNGALRTATSEVYLAELSTPSLHLSWMLKQLGLASGPAFLANGGIGAAAYVVFRVVWPPLMAWRHRDAAPWALEPGGDRVHAAFLACAAVFWGLNLFWFRKLWRMIAGAVGGGKKGEDPGDASAGDP